MINKCLDYFSKASLSKEIFNEAKIRVKRKSRETFYFIIARLISCEIFFASIIFEHCTRSAKKPSSDGFLEFAWSHAHWYSSGTNED